MDAVANWFIEFFSGGESAVGLLALMGAAGLEYVFPPFPGDTITLFGAFLVTAANWSIVLVFSAVMLGSVLGALAAFFLGRRLRHRVHEGSKLARLVAGFERHGARYLVINRFLPGVRALFFVAAGMASLSLWTVAFYAALSAALWNAALMAVGAALGANYQAMLAYVKQYSLVVLVTIAFVALAAAVVWWRRPDND